MDGGHGGGEDGLEDRAVNVVDYLRILLDMSGFR